MNVAPDYHAAFLFIHPHDKRLKIIIGRLRHDKTVCALFPLCIQPIG